MKVTAERIPEAQMVLDIEIDPEQTKKSLDQAARRLAQRYRIPGFRQGKAPRQVIENTLGEDLVFEEAFERLIPKAYDEAIEQEGIEPIGAPDLEIMEKDPVRFKATVPLQPVVDLGDYATISVEKETSEVSDEQVADTLLELRRQHAVLEPAERPIEYDDHVRIDVRAEADGEQVLNEEGIEFALREEMVIAVPGLTEQLVGLTKGPEHEVSVDVPEDHNDAEVAGKIVTFLVTVHDIKSEDLPELDDDLASEVGDFKTIEELRSRVRSDLVEAQDQRITNEFHEGVINAVIQKASVEFAPSMVDHELDHMMGEMAQQSGQELEAYMQALGPAANQIRESMRERAADRVLRSIVLSEATSVEAVEVEESDIDAEIDRMIGDSPQAEQLRGVFGSDQSRQMIRGNLTTKKTLDALGEHAIKNFDAGEPPTLAAPDDESAEESADDMSAEDSAADAENQADASSAEESEADSSDD